MSVMEISYRLNQKLMLLLSNDEMALGAIQAIEAAGRRYLVAGFDATDDAAKLLKKVKWDDNSSNAEVTVLWE